MERARVPTVREIMTTRLVTLHPEMSIIEAAGLLLKHEISGAPVVDEEGQLLGLLSEFDVLRAIAASEYEMDGHDSIELVSDLMSREPVTISPDADLFALAHEFVTSRMRRFPVVEDGHLLGQVSRRDALRAAVKVRSGMDRAVSRSPIYPKGRSPIRDYPRPEGRDRS